MDSGASHLVVKAPSLLDRGTTHEPEDEPASINTASGSLPVRAAGDFLAKLTPPGAPGTSPRPIVVRAPALLVPGLQSPNLIPVSVLAESEGVSVLFDDDGANLTFADVDGNSVTVTFPCRSEFARRTTKFYLRTRITFRAGHGFRWV